MVDNFIMFNSNYQIDIYNSIGKGTKIRVENDNMFYVQGEVETPIFNIGQGEKTIEEQIEYLLNKGIIDKEQNELE
jgi:hypothetical protein